MFATLVSALRQSGLTAAASLCPREHKLPGGDSRLDRAWRLGLYRALQQGDERFYANQCDLSQLFVPNTLKVFSNVEKQSSSDSVIMSGILAPPTDIDLAQRYASAWLAMKCDVIVKATFPRTYDEPPRTQVSAMDAEVQLYDFLSKLVDKKVTPNLVIGLGVFDCTFEQLRQSNNAQSANALIAEARQIYAQRRLPLLRSDPVRLLLLERGRGFTLDKGLESGQIDEQQLISLSFQILYTLDALARRQIRHGDLHVGNVYVDVLSDTDTEIAYFPFDSDDDDETSAYYQIPTHGFVAKIYDWDWGGVYRQPIGARREAAWPRPERLVLNAYTCEQTNRRQYGACGTNQKADCFTLFTNLYDMPETARMPTFRRFVRDAIDRRLLHVAPKMGDYGGFQYRACRGPVTDRCPADRNASIVTGRACNGLWNPPECLMKSPRQMLQSALFGQFRFVSTERLPTTKYIYGNWQTEDQFRQMADLERAGEPPPPPPPQPKDESSARKRRIEQSATRAAAREVAAGAEITDELGQQPQPQQPQQQQPRRSRRLRRKVQRE